MCCWSELYLGKCLFFKNRLLDSISNWILHYYSNPSLLFLSVSINFQCYAGFKQRTWKLPFVPCPAQYNCIETTCCKDRIECICEINWIRSFWKDVSGIKTYLNSFMVISYLSFIPCYVLEQGLVVFILLETICSTYSTSGMLRENLISF